MAAVSPDVDKLSRIDIDGGDAAGLLRLCRSTVAALLIRLVGIGPVSAMALEEEAFHRAFANRRHVAAYSGLTPTPFQSGESSREQGIAKAGNPRLRRVMLELAWLWLRYQPDSPNGGRRSRIPLVGFPDRKWYSPLLGARD
ncbi:MAG: transposase [Rhodospirillaceae bacterium]